MGVQTKHFTKTLSITLIALLSGPILVVIALLSGAQPLDGLFGVYHNTPFQSAILGMGYLATLLGWIAAVLYSGAMAFKHRQSNEKFRLLFVAAIPFLLVVAINFLIT